MLDEEEAVLNFIDHTFNEVLCLINLPLSALGEK